MRPILNMHGSLLHTLVWTGCPRHKVPFMLLVGLWCHGLTFRSLIKVKLTIVRYKSRCLCTINDRRAEAWDIGNGLVDGKRGLRCIVDLS